MANGPRDGHGARLVGRTDGAPRLTWEPVRATFFPTPSIGVAMMPDWGMMTWMYVVLFVLVAGVVVAIVLAVRATQAATAPIATPVAPPAVQVPPARTGPVESAPAVVAPASLRLLDEDERRVLELVRARGGDVPQGDLVPLSGYSKAKVSRVLDRLEGKGLVVRLRRGMTNQVVLAPEKPVA